MGDKVFIYVFVFCICSTIFFTAKIFLYSILKLQHHHNQNNTMIKKVNTADQHQGTDGHLKIWVESHVAGGAVPPAVPAVVAVSTLAT